MKFAFAALFSLLLLAACGGKSDANATQQAPDEKSVKAATPSRKNIIFFGNSLTAAYNLSPEQGYVALVQKKIDSLKLEYSSVNAGLSGETTADGKNRVEWVLQQPADIFVLELGGNDALRGLPVDASLKNLEAILEAVKAKYPNCKLVIAGMMAPPNLGATYTRAFEAMYPDLAKRYNAALIPFLLEGVGGVAALNLEDGIHPNVAGQKIVAENVWKTLKGVL
jgi:acyl-CoA thioesterase I